MQQKKSRTGKRITGADRATKGTASMVDSTRSHVLDRQLEFFQSQSEGWKPAHDEAMDRFELELAIALGLTLFKSIGLFTEFFNARAKERNVGYDEATAKAIQKRYLSWYESCGPLLKLLRKFEAAGHTIARSREFVEACRDARLPAFELDRVASAMTQFSRGRGKPLAEAMDELRRRVI